MKAKIILPVVVFFLSLSASPAATLFSENFDVDPTSNWTVRQAATSTDSSVDFNFDYGTVLGIPSAPNSIGGTTRGMRFLANQSAGVQQGITAYPTGMGFTGNYRLRFDMWLCFNGPAPAGGNGSTQCGSFGIGATGASVLWAGNSPNGVMFAATGDGGSSFDYRCYYTNGLVSATTPGVYEAGTGANDVIMNNTHPYYSVFGGESAPESHVEKFPQQTGATGVGALGWAWRDVIVEKNGNIITWRVDGVLIATADTNFVVNFSTNIFFGQFDINATSSSDANDALITSIYDNVRVESLEGPQVDIVATGDTKEGEAPGGFTITRTGDTGSALMVNYIIAGTAGNGVDYTNIPSSVTFAAGQSSTNLTIGAINDLETEFNETVTISISSSPNYNVGTSPAIVTIVDNETPELSITGISPTMYERVAGDYSAFSIIRKGDSTTSFDATINYSGTAAGTRFTGPTSVNIGAGVTNTSFFVNPVDDALLNGDQTIIATIPTAAGYVAGATNSASTIILDDEYPTENVLFADPLTADTSANWKTNFGANNLVDDFVVDFVSNLGGEPVSSPPNGSPTALKITVNKLDPTTNGAAGINLYPVGQSFSNDFALRFDMYIVQNSSAAIATEFALFGINHSGNKTNWLRLSGTNTFNNPARDIDGLWSSVVADASGSGPADYALLTGTNAASTATILTTAAATSFTQVFKKPPYSANNAGSPANIYLSSTPTWAAVELKKIGSLVTMSINKTPILTYTNTTPFTNGNIMLGYMDPYESVGANGGAVYYSNLRVVGLTVQQPEITDIQIVNSGTQVQIDFTGATGDSFKLQKSLHVAGPYADDDTASIISTGPGTFRATTSINAAQATQFYQIRRQ